MLGKRIHGRSIIGKKNPDRKSGFHKNLLAVARNMRQREANMVALRIRRLALERLIRRASLGLR